MLLNQTFPVIYKEKCYRTDPICLCLASAKFRELLKPYMNKLETSKLQLLISTEEFSERNIDNFLKLCQNIPTDVLDSEMTQICEIAKLFEAEEIYNTGCSFIRSKQNPSFEIPDEQYSSDSGFLSITPKNYSPKESLMLSEPSDEQEESSSFVNICEYPAYEKEIQLARPRKIMPLVYEIRVKPGLFKPTKYSFLLNGDVILSAKQNDSLIVIGRGNEVHISSDKSNHLGKIQRTYEHRNIIKINSQSYVVKYIQLPQCSTVSISFDSPKTSTTLEPLDSALMSEKSVMPQLCGKFKRTPIKSRRNTILQDPNGANTFIVRKMKENIYETECEQSFDKTLAFALSISQIIGPFIPVDVGVY